MFRENKDPFLCTPDDPITIRRCIVERIASGLNLPERIVSKRLESIEQDCAITSDEYWADTEGIGAEFGMYPEDVAKLARECGAYLMLTEADMRAIRRGELL